MPSEMDRKEAAILLIAALDVSIILYGTIVHRVLPFAVFVAVLVTAAGMIAYLLAGNLGGSGDNGGERSQT